MSIYRHRSNEHYRRVMLRALSNPVMEVPGDDRTVNPLAALDLDNDAGPLPALVRAWSLVGDVLSFYQQRIADERAISTAREDFSAYAIARMLGYEPRPAISAQAPLCFEVVASAGTVTVPAGTQIGNVPKEGQLPAVFETAGALLAFAAWNAVRPTDAAPDLARFAPSATRLVLAGTERIAPGSALVVVYRQKETTELFGVVVAEANADRDRAITLVRWQAPDPNPIVGGEEILSVSVLDQRVRPFGAFAPPYAQAAPNERRAYALGGIAVRRDGAWTLLSDGLMQVPTTLVVGRSGVFGILGAQFMRRMWDGPWSVTSPFGGIAAQSLAITPSGTLAAGTVNGGVLLSIDDGLTWTPVGDGIYAPAQKTPRTQMQRLPPIPVRGVALDESGEVPTVYAATDRGIASIALNGQLWTWRNDGFPGTNPKTGVAALAATSILVADASGLLLATTTYGVFRSRRGERWQRVQGVGSVSGVASLGDSKLVAVGAGGAFRSEDDGVTWERIPAINGTPHAIASDAQCVIVGAGSDAYASDDGGATWSATPAPLRTPIVTVAAGPGATLVVAAPFVDDPAPDWPGLALSGNVLRLEREVTLVAGDLLALSIETEEHTITRAYRVRSAIAAMLAEFGVIGVSTIVTLDRAIDPALCDARRVVVHLGASPRTALAVKRESPPPPGGTIGVPRGLPILPPGRALAIEGRPARVLASGYAGAATRVAPSGRDVALGDGVTTMLVDVDAFAPYGANGAVVARFDGLWRCDDLARPVWTLLAANAPGTLASLAVDGERIHATFTEQRDARTRGLFTLEAGAWKNVLPGAMRRVRASGGRIWACGDQGLYRLENGVWSIVDRRLEGRAVNDVTVDGDGALAATDDGVFVRLGAEWHPFPSRLDGMRIITAAADAGHWYAGSDGAGTWSCERRAGHWHRSDGMRSTVVQAIGIDGDRVLAAERGVGVCDRGTTLELALATNVLAFAPFTIDGAACVIAVRGTPLLPPLRYGGDATAMRRPIAVLGDDDPNDPLSQALQTLDAGMLATGLRARIESATGLRLGSFEIVVENYGRAWRIHAGDLLPAYLLRRERLGCALFELLQVELDDIPQPIAGTALARWTLLGAWQRPVVLIAGDDDLWYTPARTNVPARAEQVTASAQTDGSVVLAVPPRYAYDPRTVTIYGNVVGASHGATIARDEVIASGNASLPAQQAALASKPLSNAFDGATVVPDLDVWIRSDVEEDPVAATAALANRDRDNEMVRWQWVESLATSGPTARNFAVSQEADGRATVLFGDGENGRRLPTGRDNVVARYRVGSGAAGNVPAASLSLFARPHAGLARVTNPLAALGGVDAENLDDLRHTATRSLISLGRVVSVHDLADFAAAWPGVRKVDVRRLPHSRDLVATLAPGAPDVDVDALWEAVQRYAASRLDVRFVSYRERPFIVRATLFADADRDAAALCALAFDALARAYVFERRVLGEEVRESDITALLQRIPGVRAIHIDALQERSGVPALDGRLVDDRENPSDPTGLFVLDAAASSIQPGTL